MNLTARNLPPGEDLTDDMNATIDHRANQNPLSETFEQPGLGPDDRPKGSPNMPTPKPQAQNRYTYGSGARPLDGYTIKRAIGRGGFGEVYYATSDAGKETAIKLILRNLDIESRGVKQCMNLKSPNLLSIYDLRTTDAGETFVVMEYVSGPSLANILKDHPDGIPAAEARAWLRGLVAGVAYLHDHGIVHRDLKPANLFMEEGVVKIGDYGLAKLITPNQGSEHSESIGTCHYMAPEIASGKYTASIDIYSIGIIVYEMLTGRVPFEGETVGEVLMKHLTARPDVSKLAEPYRSIVAKALEKDPKRRQKTVMELLPAEDAPQVQNVRFIGEGKTAPPLGHGTVPERGRKKDEEILRIEAEEPVFYIGPDTRPPIAQRIRTGFANLRRPLPRPAAPNGQANRPQPRPAPAPRPVRQAFYQPQAPKAKVKPQAAPPQPPPTPPPLPGMRARVAELTSAMVNAAPVAAVLALPVAFMLGVDPSGQPERYAFLFTMGLLGAWATLVPTKLLEGRDLSKSTRRLAVLGIGALVGLAATAFATWTNLGTLPSWDAGIDPRVISDLGADPSWLGQTSPAVTGLYFALVSLVGGWPWMAVRDRKKRFRIFPVLKAGALAGLIGLALPFPQPWGVGIAVLTAAVVQVVSPWSQPAATYARYAARVAKLQKKGRLA